MNVKHGLVGSHISRNGQYSGVGKDMTTYSVDSFQSNRRDSEEESDTGTWYQKPESSSDIIEDAVEYSVSRVSGPLSPMSTNIEWRSGVRRTRTPDYGNEKVVVSSGTSGHGNGEIAFI
jgi:hypothetical protein